VLWKGDLLEDRLRELGVSADDSGHIAQVAEKQRLP
jgi:hypothetical protein